MCCLDVLESTYCTPGCTPQLSEPDQSTPGGHIKVITRALPALGPANAGACPRWSDLHCGQLSPSIREYCVQKAGMDSEEHLNLSLCQNAEDSGFAKPRPCPQRCSSRWSCFKRLKWHVLCLAARVHA